MPKSKTEPTERISTSEAAKMLNISTQYFLRLAKDDRFGIPLRSTEHGHPKWDRDIIEAYLEKIERAWRAEQSKVMAIQARASKLVRDLRAKKRAI